MGTRRYGRYVVETSSEDKVLFPAAGRTPGRGLTKGGLIDYYERIADRLLPHLRGRALVLHRFPDGVEAEGFYQKQATGDLPDWATTTQVELRTAERSQELVVCDKKATLAWLANQACIALHPWLSRADRPDRPDRLIVDLDPPGDGFAAVREAARRVRGLLEDELGLPCFAKLSGSKGVHVVVPLDRSEGFDAVRAFAREAMEVLAERHPGELTTEHRVRARRGRLYLDVARNAYGQTAVAPWSVRALPEAPVAAPVAWKQLERGDLGPRDYTVTNVFRRSARRADPWAGLRRRAVSLRRARESLQELRADGG